MKTEVIVIGGLVLLVLASKTVIANTTGKLSVAELLRLAHDAGFEDTAALIDAVAIALAESSGEIKAIGDIDNPTQGSASYGLWQINSYYHPEFGPDFNRLLDPHINAAAAFTVYSAAGFSFQPWSTYKNGAYEKYLDTVTGVFNTISL